MERGAGGNSQTRMRLFQLKLKVILTGDSGSAKFCVLSLLALLWRRLLSELVDRIEQGRGKASSGTRPKTGNAEWI